MQPSRRTHGAPPTITNLRGAHAVSAPMPTLREREAFWRTTAVWLAFAIVMTLWVGGVEVAKLRAENAILRASAGVSAR